VDAETEALESALAAIRGAAHVTDAWVIRLNGHV
jgi:hypothetical protein